MIERVTAAAFGQRRKMLRSSLKSLGPDSDAMIEEAGLDPTARAEEISGRGVCRARPRVRQTRRLGGQGAHEVRQARLARAFVALGLDDVGDLGFGDADVVVDDHVVVFGPVAEFVVRLGHALSHDFGGILGARVAAGVRVRRARAAG